jgi:colicin import membrane protein
MTDLIVIEQITPEVFKGVGIEELIKSVKVKVKAFQGDVTTDAGRKDIASFAYKIARSKTAVDDIGKEEVAQYKQISKVIDDKRKLFRDAMDAFKDEVRKPLTDFENAEKERVDRHKNNITEIQNGGNFTQQNWQEINLEAMQERLKEVEEDLNLEWQEFKPIAEQSIKEAAEKIRTAIERRKDYDAERAELAKLRQEQVEREQKEREQRIAKEATERAQREAEEKAKEVAAKVEAERLQALREKEIAEIRIKEAEARAQREIEEAKAQEQRRIELEKAEVARREADLKHKSRIFAEIKDGLKIIGICEAESQKLIEAIHGGAIPHLTIKF